MAIGAMTIVKRMPLDDCGTELIKVTFAGDGAYPTGGTLWAAINAALATALKAVVAAATDKNVRGLHVPTIRSLWGGDCGQYAPFYATAGLKVLDAGSGTRAQAAGAANLSGTTFTVTFVCE